jgi:hypothetical protein
MRYGHTPAQLQTILSVEGGQTGLEMPNKNGSFDLGPFQINDRVWVPRLAQVLKERPDVVRRALRDDSCFNAYAAGYVLRLAIEDSGGDVWEGMGRYHSATPIHKQRYQHLLAAAYRRGPARLGPGAPIRQNSVPKGRLRSAQQARLDAVIAEQRRSGMSRTSSEESSGLGAGIGEATVRGRLPLEVR